MLYLLLLSLLILLLLLWKLIFLYLLESISNIFGLLLGHEILLVFLRILDVEWTLIVLVYVYNFKVDYTRRIIFIELCSVLATL